MGTTSCSHPQVVKKTMPDYRTDAFGIPLHLINAVEQDICAVCQQAIGADVHIPNTPGLIAAATVARVKLPEKLLGREIKFIRKALRLTAKELAEILEVQVETVSRWENDKQPMNPTTEKMLRVLAATLLKDQTAISYDPKEIISMKLSSVRDSDAELVISLQLIRVLKAEDRLLADAYLEDKRAA